MKKMSGADAFERSVKEALEHYEVPYNSADWAQMDKRLSGQKSHSWTSAAGLYVLFMGGAIAVATTLYVMLSTDPGNGGTGNMITLATEDEGGVKDQQNAIATDRPADTAVYEEVADTEQASVAIPTRVPKVNHTPARADQAVKSSVNEDPSSTRSEEMAGTDAGTTTLSPFVKNGNAKAITIKPSVTEGCPGTTVDFAVENMPEGGMHLWNFGDGNFSNKATPSHTFSKAGTFEVMLSHSSMGGGSIRNKPASDRIVIHEAPDASFKTLKQEYDGLVPYVHFENRSNGGSKYEWDFGDGNTSSIPHPDHVYKTKGTYAVMLTVTNALGCVDRTERTVVIDNDYNLLAPTGFSPDGNGFEDTFIPEALKTLGARFHMTIYSKSGDLLYETTDAQRPWNGKVNNRGDLCTPGEYVWLVEMKDGDRLGGTYTGNVSLVR